MLIDKLFDHYDPTTMIEDAAEIEAAGYDGVLLGEAAYDPFLALGLAAVGTSHVDLAVSVAVALPRSPTHVAYTAHDLQVLSGGRFILGLGSQIRPHVERRFGAVWNRPVEQMREFVLAVRAIWAAWEDQTTVDFQGEHYRITLMTPYFSPSPVRPIPPIWLAAVGPKMSVAAGEVADGVFLHPFSTSRYVAERSRPWIEEGRVRAGVPEPRRLAMPVMVATGADDESRAVAEAEMRKQIAFYASTPSYRPVLDLHGWGDLQPELNRLSKEGRWDEMTRLVDDEVIDELGVRGTPDEVGRRIVERFGHLLSRASIYTPNHDPGPETMAQVVASIRAAAGAPHKVV